MARTFSGTAQYLSKGAALVAAVPMTFAGFAYFNAPLQDAIIVGQGIPTGTAGPGCHIYHNAGQHWFEAEAFGDVDDETAHTTTSPGLITWYHVAAVFASNTSRQMYLNGVQEGTSAVAVSLAGTMTDTRIGNICLNLTGFTMLGAISMAAVWNAALTAPEILALSQGISPKLIRLSALKGYCRMLGGFSPEPDLIGGSWTLVGAPTYSADPRIFNP